ncbi:H-NS family nucleoid-associated regulatory protein [Burkholderia dolosa]
MAFLIRPSRTYTASCTPILTGATWSGRGKAPQWIANAKTAIGF